MHARLDGRERHSGTDGAPSRRRQKDPTKKEDTKSVPTHHVHDLVLAGLTLRMLGRDLVALLRRGAAAGVRVGMSELLRISRDRDEEADQ